MFRIAWFQVAYFSVPAVFALILYWTRRRSSPGWTKAVAEQLGGNVKGPRLVEGRTAGLPWEVQLALGLSSHSRPSWRVTFPTVVCTDLVVRAETRGDAGWKKRGFIEEISVGDESFDARHLLLGAQPAAASALLRHEPLRAALSALPLEESQQSEGRILWVQMGEGLEAEIDVSALPEEDFAERLAELFRQLVTLAQVVREAPSRGTPGTWRRRLVDTQAEWRWLLLYGWSLVPVGFSLQGALAVETGTVEGLKELLQAMLMGLVGAGLLALPYGWWLRRSPFFHRHILRIPMLLMTGLFLGPLVKVGLNTWSSTPVVEREAKILGSDASDMGILEVWRLELEGVGPLKVPWEVGSGVREGELVRVRMTQGALGSTRILSWEPEQPVR